MTQWSPLRGRPATLVPYLLAFSISWALAVVVALWVGNGRLFLLLNGLGSKDLDAFFGFLSWVGEGWVFGITAILLFAWHRRAGLTAIGALIISAVASTFLKRIVFGEWVRPQKFFGEGSEEVHWPDGVDIHDSFSFPSGHSTNIFCLACIVAYFFPKPWVQVGVLVVAWLVGVSRIMQAQHFPFDVLAGAMLGTLSAVIARDAFFKWNLARKFGLPTGESAPSKDQRSGKR